jgi:hypothetical protein
MGCQAGGAGSEAVAGSVCGSVVTR